jgi:hypothetical protein
VELAFEDGEHSEQIEDEHQNSNENENDDFRKPHIVAADVVVVARANEILPRIDPQVNVDKIDDDDDDDEQKKNV